MTIHASFFRLITLIGFYIKGILHC